MASHRFRFFSIGLGVGASLGLLMVSRPSSVSGGGGIAVDDPLSGNADDREGGDAGSMERIPVPARPRPEDLEVARDSGMQAYRDALGQRW